MFSVSQKIVIIYGDFSVMHVCNSCAKIATKRTSSGCSLSLNPQSVKESLLDF